MEARLRLSSPEHAAVASRTTSREPGARSGGRQRADGRGSARRSDAMSQRLATQIEHDVESPLPWRSIAKKTVMVVVAGITIYLVFPSLTEVFAPCRS